MVPNLDPRRLPTQGKCKWDLNNFIDYGTRYSRKICHILASFRFQESGWYLIEDTSWSQMEAQPGESTLHLPDYCIQSIWIRYKNYLTALLHPTVDQLSTALLGSILSPFFISFSHSWFIPMILCSTISQEIVESVTLSYVNAFIIIQNVGTRNLQLSDKKK